MHNGKLKEIRAPFTTIKSNKNKLCILNVVNKTLSKMNRKYFWLNPNESVDYGRPKINLVCNEGKSELCLNLDK